MAQSEIESSIGLKPSGPSRPRPGLEQLGDGLRNLLLQGAILGVIAAVLYSLFNNAVTALARQGTASGFAFLSRSVPFDISETVIPFQPGDSYANAFLAGLSNTLLVAGCGIIIAAVLGFLIGLARLSPNYLLSRLASTYVEWMRNVPLVLHLCLWYVVMAVNLPPLRMALEPVPGLFLSNRGLQTPRLLFETPHLWLLAALGVGAVFWYFWLAHARRYREARGRRLPVLMPTLGAMLAAALLIYLSVGVPVALEIPVKRGFNFAGGLTLTPEFVALVAGLGLYTSAFIAEIVRAGIMAVKQGQREAGESLGLHASTIMWRIIMPQAMRVIVPPTTTQFSNLMKNSSLAVAIGYPDLVSVTNTSLNQTGQAIECIAIMMAIYLLLSSVITLVMGLINNLFVLVER